MIFSPLLRSLTSYFFPAGQVVGPIQAAPQSIPVSQTGIWYCPMPNNHGQCWEAIGPIQECFNQMSNGIRTCLKKYGPLDDATVSWSLYMIGKSRDTARPTILFCSSSKTARKMVRGLVEEDRILSVWISFGFQVGDCSIHPDHYRIPNDRLQRLSSGEILVEGLLNTSELRESTVWSTSTTIGSGTRVFFKPSFEGNKTQFSTIGKIFSANGKYYATTVGHLFARESEKEPEEPVAFEFDIGGDRECVTSSDFVINIEDRAEKYVVDDQSPRSSLQTSKMDLPSTSTLHLSGQNLVKIGRLVYVDTESGLDYAIIEIDVSRITCTEYWNGEERHVKAMAKAAYQSPKSTAVVAMTSSHGAIKGRMSETPSFIRFSRESQFREVWTVRFDQPLAKGDCGSMVVDSEAQHPCGHIVAGSPRSGVAYIVPAYEIFEDIKKNLGVLQDVPKKAKWSLPRLRQQFFWWSLSLSNQASGDHGINTTSERIGPKIRSSLEKGHLSTKQEVCDKIRVPEFSNPNTKREMLRDLIDSRGVPWRVLVAAALEFSADSYCIFATNAMLPLLSSLYYTEEVSHSLGLKLNVAALFGATIGQLFFGIAADIWGRRRLHGLELILLILGVLGILQTSSVTPLVWIVFWRFIMGIGIGGGYPLSATITAEFAPSRYRTRMLTLVSLAQPFGQLCVELTTTFGARQVLKLGILGLGDASGVNRYLLDQLWRFVIGVGVLPALIALILRYRIPESPLYTADILRDIDEAADAVKKVWGLPEKRLELELPFTASCQSDGPIKDETETTRKLTWFLVAFNGFLGTGGNWRYLAGTSVCWFLFDIAFYGLGLNSPRQVSKVWCGELGDIGRCESPFAWAPNVVWIDILAKHASTRVDIRIFEWLAGCFLCYYAVTHLARRKFQLFGFLGLFITLLVLGSHFTHFGHASQHLLVLFLFCLCQVFFNFGPNTTTFMLPAEIFPTRFRGTAYGISAATGKIGSIIAQIILQEVGTSTLSPTSLISMRTGPALLLVSAFMLIGAFVTWQWIPEPQWSDQPGAVLGKWKSTALSRWLEMKKRTGEPARHYPSMDLKNEMGLSGKNFNDCQAVQPVNRLIS